MKIEVNDAKGVYRMNDYASSREAHVGQISTECLSWFEVGTVDLPSRCSFGECSRRSETQVYMLWVKVFMCCIPWTKSKGRRRKEGNKGSRNASECCAPVYWGINVICPICRDCSFVCSRGSIA